MEKLLAGKNALITGGSRGIGKAMAIRFAEQGANVAFTYLSSEEKAKKLEEEIAAKGVKAKAYRSDASSFSEADQLIKDFVKDFGTLDVLINNAGVTRDGLLMRMSEEQWDMVININLKSVFNLVKAATRTFLKQKQDAGATTAITQFFFEAESYFRFVEEARKAGITIPIIPGILPINNITQLRRFADRCGATIPNWVSKAFEGLEDNPETAAAVAVSLCLDLCRDLIDAGVDAFHFYTLNRSPLTEAVCRLLSIQAEEKEAA